MGLMFLISSRMSNKNNQRNDGGQGANGRTSVSFRTPSNRASPKTNNEIVDLKTSDLEVSGRRGLILLCSAAQVNVKNQGPEDEALLLIGDFQSSMFH